MLFRPTYGGTLVSRTNPVPDFHWNIAGLKLSTDANVTAFMLTVIILLAAMGALASA